MVKNPILTDYYPTFQGKYTRKSDEYVDVSNLKIYHIRKKIKKIIQK